MAREIRKDEAKRYIGKAEDFYSAALDEYEKGRLDVAVFNASQSVILANDALCIFLLGKRPSKNHREAVSMHAEALRGKENRKEIVSEALEKRGEFAYTEKTASAKDANMLVIRSKRFLEWTKEAIGYD